MMTGASDWCTPRPSAILICLDTLVNRRIKIGVPTTKQTLL
jgi:hypothetical protein